MEQEKLNHPDDDFTTVDTSMMSSTSPYQPTTEPAPRKRSLVGGMNVNIHYAKSLPGVLKAAEIICNIVVAICVGIANRCSHSGAPISFMLVVSVICLFATCLLYITFLLNLHRRLEFVDWPLTDLVNVILSSLFYLIGSSILLANLSNSDCVGAEKAAVAFGYVCTLLYLCSVWLVFQAFLLERRKSNPTVSHIKGVSENTETQELT